MRLQGPSSANGSGRLEVFYNGEWGTICDDSWGFDNTMVACRQLGYLYAIRTLQGHDVPDGSGRIWLDDVRCTGGEQNLTSCSHKGWGNVNCIDHSNDVGIHCSQTGISGILLEKTLKTNINMLFAN